ncbi:exported hypothetical protein [uncultured Pleomorphomonas sp.]|uniref:Uncharacterized protein n=1 Tax=uncultured Pleomorphomonas sp. TaxID=442121 RepID=A0A212LL30_9HYPH|nr:exported hypothetical protein [uncultured Pleomorphomonas sp.]
MVVPTTSTPSATAAFASSMVEMSAMASLPWACTALQSSATATGRTRSVASKAMMSAPASASAATSSRKGVMRIGDVSRSRLMRPMIGASVAARTALRLAMPSMRRPRPPDASAASAKPTTWSGWSSGPSGTGWQETTSDEAKRWRQSDTVSSLLFTIRVVAAKEPVSNQFGLKAYNLLNWY